MWALRFFLASKQASSPYFIKVAVQHISGHLESKQAHRNLRGHGELNVGNSKCDLDSTLVNAYKLRDSKFGSTVLKIDSFISPKGCAIYPSNIGLSRAKYLFILFIYLFY